LKTHQYPDKKEAEYEDYYELARIDQNQVETKNKILVVDCEMVSSVNGFELARATIINFEGEIIFDEFFKPDIEIVNYNTPYSGITA
jgi:RNA exonuclease 1